MVSVHPIVPNRLPSNAQVLSVSVLYVPIASVLSLKMDTYQKTNVEYFISGCLVLASVDFDHAAHVRIDLKVSTHSGMILEETQVSIVENMVRNVNHSMFDWSVRVLFSCQVIPRVAVRTTLLPLMLVSWF